jgi:DNA-binding transcriptional LysR family regulator
MVVGKSAPWTSTSARCERSSPSPITTTSRRAAQSLHLSQQALSRRIAALEARVGVLVDRHRAGASLTDRGERLLPAARGLLEAADHALATALGEPPATLRLDVWGPVDPPEALVRAFAADHPDAILEIGMRRNLPAALDALRRHELDAVLGNVTSLGKALTPGLSARLVATTPLGALVTDGREAVTWDDLRRSGVAIPSQPSLPEFRGFLLEFAAAVDAPTRDDTRGVDLDRLVERIGIDAITLVPATWKPPKDAGARVAAISPAPLFPWSVVWRTASPHPLLRALLDALRTHDFGVDGASWLPSAVREQHVPPGGARGRARGPNARLS